MKGRIRLARVSRFTQVTNSLERLGASPEGLLRRLNMPMWHHCQPNGFVPFRHLYTLMHHGARAAGTETFGVQVLETGPFQAMGAIGELIACTPTVHDGLKTFIRLLPFHGTSRSWWLEEAAEEVWICRGGKPVFGAGEAEMCQYALASMVQLVRLGAGPRWRPSTVRMQVPYTPALADADPFLGACIIPDQTVSAICVPRSVLGLPIRRNDLSRACSCETTERQLRTSAPADDFAGSLRQLIRTLLSEGPPQIEEAAEITGLSVRTLQRRLSRDGVSYSDLVQQARYAVASEMLADPHAMVIDVAYAVGYEDPANFARAFRRICGMNPREFRRSARAALSAA